MDYDQVILQELGNPHRTAAVVSIGIAACCVLAVFTPPVAGLAFLLMLGILLRGWLKHRAGSRHPDSAPLPLQSGDGSGHSAAAR